jgi:hypothetical protein
MSSSADFEKLTDDIIYGSLALSPVGATQSGYHEHNGMKLDEMLDDYSAAGIEGQRKFYEGVQTRIAGLNARSLDKEQQADLEVIKNDLGLALLDLNTIQSYKHNPTVYVELAGNALFVPSILEYAPKEQRFQHIIKRLEKMPALFEQARANLVDSPAVWNRVAREENGRDDRLDRPGPPRRRARSAEGGLHRAAAALAALRDFSAFLRRTFKEDQRLAAWQGELREEIRVRSCDRKDTGTVARRSRSSPDNAAGNGEAGCAENGQGGTR